MKRARKSVDYSQFGGGDTDDDDDFADSTPPPSKKPMKKSQAPKPNNSRTEKRKVDQKLKKAREASQEKKFEEDLQMAIALSATSTPKESKQNDRASAHKDTDNKSVTIKAEIERPAPLSTTTPVPHTTSPTASSCQVASSTREGDDAIEVIDQDVIEIDSRGNIGRSRRRAATNASRNWSKEDDDDSDSDGTNRITSNKKTPQRRLKDSSDEADLSADSEDSGSDDDWDDDEDFCGGSKKKTVAKGSVKKPNKTPQSKSSKTESHGSKNKVQKNTSLGNQQSTKISQPVPSVKPRTPVMSAARKGFKQVSPAPKENSSPLAGPKKNIACGMPRLSGSLGVSKSSSLKSSSSPRVSSPGGGLRLGLSRKANIKPLHPSVNIVR